MDANDIISAMHKRHGLKSSEKIGLLHLSTKSAVVEGDDRTVEFAATTNFVDLSGDATLPEGADWSYFDLNKQIFVDHRYESEFNVGVMRSRSLFTANGETGWKIRAYFYKGLRHPHADDALQRVVQGGQGMSVGYIPLSHSAPTPEEAKRFPNADAILRKYKVLEFSVTPIPDNGRCQSDPEPKSVMKPEPKTIIIV